MIPLSKKHKLWGYCECVQTWCLQCSEGCLTFWLTNHPPAALRLKTEEFTISRSWKNPMLSLIATPTVSYRSSACLWGTHFVVAAVQIKPWPTPSDFVATCSFYHGYAFKPKQAGAFMAASFHPSGCTETENLRPTGLPLAAGETGPCPCCWHNEHSSVERAPAKLATGRGPWGWKTHPSGLHRLLNRPGQHGSIWPAMGQTWVPTTIHPKYLL